MGAMAYRDRLIKLARVGVDTTQRAVSVDSVLRPHAIAALMRASLAVNSLFSGAGQCARAGSGRDPVDRKDFERVPLSRSSAESLWWLLGEARASLGGVDLGGGFCAESDSRMPGIRLAIEELACLASSGEWFSGVRAPMQSFLIGVWDHFVHGDSEVLVCVMPDDESEVYEIDRINVGIGDLPNARHDLHAIGDFRFHAGLAEEMAAVRWSDEEGYLGAGVFVGDYVSFVATLAKYERREALIPALRRENQSGPVLTAVACATVHASREGLLSTCVSDVGAVIRSCASDVFAVPEAALCARQFVSSLAAVIDPINPDERSLLDGPYWLNAHDFFKETALMAATQIQGIPAALTADYRIVFDVSKCPID